LYIFRGLQLLVGRQSVPIFAVKGTLEEALTDKSVKRLYIYSKEDEIIYWKDVEEHAGAAAATGYIAEQKLFKGSGHVSHMKTWPEEYWETVLQAWINRNNGRIDQ
jgi:hypothetical protein